MFLQSFYTPGLAIYSYLIGDTSTKKAAVIDPTREIEQYISRAKQEGLYITDILETHVHADFASGSQELKQALQGKALIHCSALGGKQWIPQYADHQVLQGDTVILGTTYLRALHTPGHTPEHLTWLVYDGTRSSETPCLAFTGDFLFVGSVGRPDLLGKEELQQLALQLHQSLTDQLASLPDYLEIFPAHGAGSLCGKGLSARPSSTLGYERLSNPFFKEKSFEEWSQELLHNIPAAPLNFYRLKKANLKGDFAMSPHDSTPEKSSITIIDVRSPELFAQGHKKGSLNIPLGSGFCNWVASVLNGDVALELIAEKPEQLTEAIKNLHLIGFDQIARQLIWKEGEGVDKEILSLMEVESLAKQLKEDPQSLYVVDVRTPAEWEAGHIEDAHHLQLGTFKEHFRDIPKDKTIAVICGSGFRASLAASLLKREGYPKVVNIRGGMAAWNSNSR